MKESSRWHSERLGQEVQLLRWGTVGTPVLLFPTAGGDAEEVERFLMIEALSSLLEAGRVKVYSTDAIASRALLTGDRPASYCSRLMNQFDSFLYHEVVPAIRMDCRTPDIEIVTAGASIGAFNALAFLCRHPDVVRLAVCMSGSYDLQKLLGASFTRDFFFSSPLHFLPRLPDGGHLNALRRRFVLLTHGRGRWEDPDNDWRMADLLGSKGIPNRVDSWGEEWDHDWVTWRAMLPKYLGEMA